MENWIYENSWSIIVAVITLTAWLSVLNYRICVIPKELASEKKDIMEKVDAKILNVHSRIDTKTDMLVFVRVEETIKSLIKSFEDFKISMEKKIDEIKKK
jgi:hypothetical protein